MLTKKTCRLGSIYTLLFLSFARAEQIFFDSCDGSSEGIVTSVDITPCKRSIRDPNGPCRFYSGSNYNISSKFSWTIFFSCVRQSDIDILRKIFIMAAVQYTSLVDSGDRPRSSLVARDDSRKDPFEYAYSGQAFDGKFFSSKAIEN